MTTHVEGEPMTEQEPTAPPSGVPVERSEPASGLTGCAEAQGGAEGRSWLSGCGCAWCGDVLREVAKDRGDWFGATRSVMHRCGTCGYKRCPHASAHWFDCTGSNESGQVGSYYGIDAPTPARADEIKAAS